MSVDMHEWRFCQELRRLPKFDRSQSQNPVVWRENFPAWRALFTSLCLYGHATGYRLPSFEQFFTYVENAYCKRGKDPVRYKKYFVGDYLEGMRQRISVWYESGMAETYLYVCLVEAIEDSARCGIVLYDPRVDWKLKTDLIVIMGGKPMRISSFFGEKIIRPELEHARDAVEKLQKKNTLKSSHWGNTDLGSLPLFEISVTLRDVQVVNGFSLFSKSSINILIDEMYVASGLSGTCPRIK